MKTRRSDTCGFCVFEYIFFVLFYFHSRVSQLFEKKNKTSRSLAHLEQRNAQRGEENQSRQDDRGGGGGSRSSGGGGRGGSWSAGWVGAQRAVESGGGTAHCSVIRVQSEECSVEETAAAERE
jgi:hypothetical protein